MRNIIKQAEIDFITQHLPKKGGKWCAISLGVKIGRIGYIARKLKIRVDKATISESCRERKTGRFNKLKVLPEKVFDLGNPQSSYLLGLLFADGFIDTKKNSYLIGLSSTRPDSDTFLKIMGQFGEWNVFYGKTNDRCKKIPARIATSNHIIKSKLIELGFNNRTGGFAKVFSYIGHENIPYFLRGLVDGDGCFYINIKNGGYRFSLCSNVKQNWDGITNFLTNRGIKWGITRVTRNSGSYSKIIVDGKSRVSSLGDIIYADTLFGLKRKYSKFLEIKKRCNKWVRQSTLTEA